MKKLDLSPIIGGPWNHPWSKELFGSYLVFGLAALLKPCTVRRKSQLLAGLFVSWHLTWESEKDIHRFKRSCFSKNGIYMCNIQGTNISHKESLLKMIFLFSRWDMLLPWRVFLDIVYIYIYKPNTGAKSWSRGNGQVEATWVVPTLRMTPNVQPGCYVSTIDLVFYFRNELPRFRSILRRQACAKWMWLRAVARFCCYCPVWRWRKHGLYAWIGKIKMCRGHWEVKSFGG